MLHMQLKLRHVGKAHNTQRNSNLTLTEQTFQGVTNTLTYVSAHETPRHDVATQTEF